MEATGDKRGASAIETADRTGTTVEAGAEAEAEIGAETDTETGMTIDEAGAAREAGAGAEGGDGTGIEGGRGDPISMLHLPALAASVACQTACQ